MNESVNIKHIDMLTTIDKKTTLLNLQTSLGIIGHTCVVQTSALTRAVLNNINSYYVDLPVLNLRFICQQLRSLSHGGLISEVIAALEFALWDIFGKQVGLSVNMLLGGNSQQAILASKTLYLNAKNDQSFIYQAEKENYLALRLIDCFSSNHSVVALEAYLGTLRPLIDPKISLVWQIPVIPINLKTAKRLADLLFDYRIDCLALPWPYIAIDEYRALQQYARIAIAPAQSPANIHTGLALIKQGAIDQLPLNVLHCGGLEAAMQIAHFAELFAIPIQMIGSINPAGFLANLHLASTLSHLASIELTIEKLKLKSWLGDTIKIDSTGTLTPSDVPGLGLFKDSQTGFPPIHD